MDNRRHVRFRVDFPTTLKTEYASAKGQVFNLSSHGCKVKADTEVKRGDYLAMRLILPQEGQPLSIFLAAVRWTNGWNFGCEFINIGQEERTRLAEYVTTLGKSPSPAAPIQEG